MNTDNQIEHAIQGAGKTAPRITPAHIQAMMDRVIYRSTLVEGTTSTFVHAFLDGDFHLATGHSACVVKENFDAEIGVRIARTEAARMAADKLWELEGYLLRDRLAKGATA